METCPVCHGVCSNRGACPHCHADLNRLLEVEESAQAHLEEAGDALRRGNYSQGLYHAGRSVSLKKTLKGLGLLCEAALFTKDFSLARRCMEQMARMNP